MALKKRKVWSLTGGGHGNPLQYSCLENPMNRRAWRATVQSQTWLKRLSTHACIPKWFVSTFMLMLPCWCSCCLIAIPSDNQKKVQVILHGEERADNMHAGNVKVHKYLKPLPSQSSASPGTPAYKRNAFLCLILRCSKVLRLECFTCFNSITQSPFKS